MTIAAAKNDLLEALTHAYGAGEATAMCRYVFDDYFQIKSNDAAQNEIFETFLSSEYEQIKTRLLAGEPVQYVVGFAWFYGLKFKVNNNVLIPRPETEELVHWVLETVQKSTKMGHKTSILDIGTGSGCIPVTLKIKNPALQIGAVDISEGALITASRNAYRHNAEVDFKRIDILDEKQWSQIADYQWIVSNPPYIPHSEKALMSINVLDFEPHLALFVENDDALIFYEKIADFAQNSRLTTNDSRLTTHNSQLTEGGIFFECNEFNAHQVVEMLKKKGFSNVELRQDMSGKDRMIKAIF
jgi:release factor glutamine methyltransferase